MPAADLHAQGAAGDGRTLCGYADEGNPGEPGSEPPAYAGAGETVTCRDCQRVIAHVQRQFTVAYRVRR